MVCRFADEEITYSGGNTTENGGHTAGRGTETCSVVEQMFSMRTSYEVTGAEKRLSICDAILSSNTIIFYQDRLSRGSNIGIVETKCVL